MDRSKKGKKSRQENFMDDEAAGDLEERKPEQNLKGKSNKDRNAKKANDVSDEEDVVDKKPAKTNQKTAGGKGRSRRVDSDEEESVDSDTDQKKKPAKQTKTTARGKNKNRPADSDEESGDNDDEKKVTSKQSKSNIKKKNKKDSQEEEVIKEPPKADSNDVKSDQKKDKKGNAKNSQKKKQEESDEDGDDIDKTEVIVPKKGTQMKKPTFQMLALESSEDEKEDEEESDESCEVKKSEVVDQKKGKKAKQNKKKAKPVEDEDIDKLVAEISSMSTTSGKKKGDKKKDQAVKEEKSDSHEVEAKPEVAITSNMTQEELYKLMDEMEMDEDDKPKAKKKKKGKQQEHSQQQQCESKEGSSNEEDEGEEKLTVKSAAQKKKEKKERQKAEKQKKTEVKGKEEAPEAKEEKEVIAKVPESKEDLGKKQDKVVADKKQELTDEKETQDQPGQEETKEPDEAEETKASKKDKKKKKDDKDKEKEKAKKPSKMVQEILERQKRIKEEEERLQREEEERIRKEEEAIRLKEEEERRIKERKEKLKQKKKEKIERKKQEGTFLTEKQKEDKRRLMRMLEIYQKEIPDEARAATAEKKPPRYEKKRPKQTRQTSIEGQDNDSALTTPVDDTTVEPVLTEPEVPVPAESKVEETEDVKDAWDISSDEEEEEEEEVKTVEAQPVATVAHAKEEPKNEEHKKSEEPASEEEEETSEEEDSEESEESSSEDDDKTPQEKAREKALAKIQKRKEDAEAKRSLDKLRAPVVCVLGHVDTGKTKILDKLRRTNVQDGEAGGITQQIGATNVPQETIREQTKMCKEFQKQELKLPGLLIIDTPGHESFSNLRSRGSSLCDIAILVVDIMHGLEPQTIESMNLLRAKKTPFVVALNKVDRLYGWQTNPHSDIINTLNRQKPNTRMEFNDRTKEVIVQFAEQGLNATLFHENKNLREYISMVPTSAHTGDGMGNLIALICEVMQNMLAKRLMFSEELKATVMEVKTIHGLGTTLDVILVNGCLHEGDTIIVAGQEGPIVTQIRALLMPQPLRELRVKGQYDHHKEVVAAQGCKIVAKDLEKALAGLPLFAAHEPDEAEIYKEELSQMLKDVLGDVKVSDKGVYVQASTLGSLEALLQFLKTSEIPYAGINIGPVHRKDIMKASVMLEHDPQYAVILAFDVKVEHEAQTMADSLGVRIFTADIIYHLFDSFMKYREDFKRQKREEFKHIAVFPCKLRIMPQHIFNSRDPIVMGVIVEAGFLKEGTLLCVPSKEFVEVGRVSSIEVNHKPVERATKGQEVCVKIDPIPGEAPKMYGRHFDATDFLVSKISRQSIDAVKNYFREEMSKTDWQLIMELKKTFEIL